MCALARRKRNGRWPANKPSGASKTGHITWIVDQDLSAMRTATRLHKAGCRSFITEVDSHPPFSALHTAMHEPSQNTRSKCRLLPA
jgi:hypothetical protein